MLVHIYIRASALWPCLLRIAWPAVSCRPAIAIWPVPVGRRWLDGANIVYTGVCSIYANTDTNMHATAMIGVSIPLMTISDRVHGIWGGACSCQLVTCCTRCQCMAGV